MSNYYLAKLNINEKILSEDEEFNSIKFNLIPKFLCGEEPFQKEMKFYYSKKDSKATAPIKSVGWKFTDVFKLDDDIIQGNIVKVTTKQSLIFSDNHADATKVEYKDDLTAVKFLYSISKEIFCIQVFNRNTLSRYTAKN